MITLNLYLDELDYKIEHLKTRRLRAEAALKLTQAEYNNALKHHFENVAKQNVKVLLAEYERRLFLQMAIKILEKYLKKGSFTYRISSPDLRIAEFHNLLNIRLKEIVKKFDKD